MDFWDAYHKYGLIPNLWAGFTGQKSAEIQNEQNLSQSQKQFEDTQEETKRQFNAELDWQQNQFGQQMNFANKQLAENKRIADLNYDLSRQNYDLQKSAFDYQKELNSTQMEREDSAIQRQIADYTAAGFSPLAAIGGNGAPSVNLSSGNAPANAPQYDISGINTASGQYADFARQYASLHQAATSNYMKEYNSAARQHNSEVLGARMALSQMKSDLHYKGQTMATQYFNAAVNYRDSLLNREYVRQQTDSLKKETEWNEIHGYRNTSPYSDIARVIEKLIPVLEKNNPSVSEVTDKIKDAYEEQKLAGSGYYESPQHASKALIKLSNFLENQEINYNPFTAKEYYDKNPDVRNIYSLDEFQSLLKKGKTGKIQRALVRQALRGSINF